VIEGWAVADVRRFYNRWYHPGNCCLYVVGNVNPRRTVERIARAFGEETPRYQVREVRSPPPRGRPPPLSLSLVEWNATRSHSSPVVFLRPGPATCPPQLRPGFRCRLTTRPTVSSCPPLPAAGPPLRLQRSQLQRSPAADGRRPVGLRDAPVPGPVPHPGTAAQFHIYRAPAVTILNLSFFTHRGLELISHLAIGADNCGDHISGYVEANPAFVAAFVEGVEGAELRPRWDVRPPRPPPCPLTRGRHSPRPARCGSRGEGRREKEEVGQGQDLQHSLPIIVLLGRDGTESPARHRAHRVAHALGPPVMMQYLGGPLFPGF